MQRITDELINSKLDPAPVSYTREELFLACLICKNLSDLCETGRAINNKLTKQKISVQGLPDNSDIETLEGIIKRYYRDEMFRQTEEEGNVPVWDEVSRFDSLRSVVACKIYRALKKNTVESPNGKQLVEAIKKHDRAYIINNFDQIFSNVPQKEELMKFKNFICSPALEEKDQNAVWDFFDSLLDLIWNEKQNVEMLKNM